MLKKTLKKALNEKSTQKSAQKSTQWKKHSKNAQISTQESCNAQGSAQNSVFTQKGVSKKYGSLAKQNYEEVHKHTQESAQKGPPKSVEGKKFSKKC